MRKSPAQLADTLKISVGQLEKLLRADNFIRWFDKKTGRPIEQPKRALERVHDRVKSLLCRIETPPYLYSAVKGRSYVSNAGQHDPRQPTVKTDIRRFYPSTREAAVFHFFLDRMKCAGDVAGILAKLLTVDGHLATGSSVSPILSYFAYSDMFDEMDQLARSRGCVMTCYVDDVVLTGPGATRRLLFDLRRIAQKYRLQAHKTKVFKAGQPKVVTGVAVTQVGARLPNRRSRAIKDDQAQLAMAKTDAVRLLIARRLTSRLYEAATIDGSWRARADDMKALRRALERRVKAEQLTSLRAERSAARDTSNSCRHQMLETPSPANEGRPPNPSAA